MVESEWLFREQSRGICLWIITIPSLLSHHVLASKQSCRICGFSWELQFIPLLGCKARLRQDIKTLCSSKVMRPDVEAEVGLVLLVKYQGQRLMRCDLCSWALGNRAVSYRGLQVSSASWNQENSGQESRPS